MLPLPLLMRYLDLQLEAAVNNNAGSDGRDWREGQSRDSETGLHPGYENKSAKTLWGTQALQESLPLQQVSEWELKPLKIRSFLTWGQTSMEQRLLVLLLHTSWTGTVAVCYFRANRKYA